METRCLECDAAMKVADDAIVGEIISCSDCGTDYEVSSLASGTVTIKVAESAKEDWGE